jgi:hypothetical protein
MYKTYPNTLSSETPGSFSADEVRSGMIALHTDYTCPWCNKAQSIAQMGGYGGRCIKCKKSSDPMVSAETGGAE